MSVIPYGRQDIDDTDIAAVVEILRSDWLTQGPTIARFEQAMADLCGARYAVAVSNATVALHLACRAVGLGSGDTLWTSPNTFVASANCALYCGAGVDFVDIDPGTLNMDPGALEQKLQQGGKPKVVIPVHFAGQSCEMEQIGALAAEHEFYVIEDASHAIGGRYRDSAVGACAHSDITVFSFHPVKIMTTAEGGLLLTNNEDLYKKLMLLRTHGITRNPEEMTKSSEGSWYYQMVDIGYNYRLTDIQAALGLSQAARVPAFVARRQELAARYRQAFATMPIGVQRESEGVLSAYHLFPIRIDPDRTGIDRKAVFERLKAAGIGVNVHYIPVHLQPVYERLGFARGQFPNAERYYDEAITLPLYYGLTEDQQDYIIDAVRQALNL